MFICDQVSNADYALLVFKEKDKISAVPLYAFSIPEKLECVGSPKFQGTYTTSDANIIDDKALEKLKFDLLKFCSSNEGSAISKSERDIYENKINSLLDTISSKHADLIKAVRDYRELEQKYTATLNKYNAVMEIVNKFTDFIIIDDEESSKEIEDYDDYDDEEGWETIYP